MDKGIGVSRMALLVAGAACGMAMAAGPGSKQVRFVDEGKLGAHWVAAEHASFDAPGYPAEFADRADDVCLAVGYRIGKDGRTSDFSVLREWNSAGGDAEPVSGYWDAFAQAGASAVSVWRFAPRDDQPVRETYTVSTMAFTGRGSAEDVLAHCRVDDLTALLQARKSDGRSRAELDMQRVARVARAAHIQAVSAAATAHAPPPPPPPVPLAAR